MEACLNETAPVVRQVLDIVEQSVAVQPKLRELSAYYGSEDWHQDLWDYDAGKLPQGIRSGVLSENGIYDIYGIYGIYGIYNVLMDSREPAIIMLETAAEIMRQT